MRVITHVALRVPELERAEHVHIGLGMHPEEVGAMVARARELGCQVLRHDPDAGQALVEDPYGMRWELEGPDMGWASPGDPGGHLER